MQTLSATKNFLFNYLKTMSEFHVVRKITVNQLADRSFWDGVNNALTPCGLLALKTSDDQGNARQRKTTWAFVIIVNGNGEDAEDKLLALVEIVQARLTHYFEEAPGLMLLPDSRLTMLETGPASSYMAGEVEIVTEDSD